MLATRVRQKEGTFYFVSYRVRHKLVQSQGRLIKSRLGGKPDKMYALVRDYLAGVRQSMGEVWGQNEKFMFTKDVTLKALVRVLGDLMKQKKSLDHWASLGTEAFKTTTQVWAGEAAQKFRAEGFYERFPPKARSSASGAFTSS